MAYASTASPFASVKGQNVFSSRPSPSVFTARPATSPPGLAAAFGASSTSTPTPVKRSGFETFASSSSPFAAFARGKASAAQGTPSKLGRAKSPPRSIAPSTFATSPFASYTGSSHVFGFSAQKRQRGGSLNGSTSHSPERIATPMTSIFGEVEHGSGDDGEADEEDRPQSFSEKLRAAKDDEYENKEDEEKLRLTEQDGVCPHYQLALFVDVSVVMTGEEEEETIHQVRGKLFSLQGNSWKERGMGVLKLNVKQEDGTGARLGMSFYARHVCLL